MTNTKTFLAALGLIMVGLILSISPRPTTEPAWATADIDTFYIKTNWDTYVNGAATSTNYGNNASLSLTVTAGPTRILTRYEGFNAILGDSMYFIAARHGLYGVSVFSASDLILRKLCKRFVETEANFIYWASGLAWTGATVLGSIAECGDMNAGDSTGTNADDDYKTIASVSGSAWNWVEIDSSDIMWAVNGNDSLWFVLYGTTVGGTASFRSSDYTTDTTKTPRLMFIVGHYPDHNYPGNILHSGKSGSKTLHGGTGRTNLHGAP